MKAIRFDAYGPPDVLRLRDVAVPGVGDGDILVRVRAASVNPWDWHHMRGKPYFMRLQAGLTRPRANRLGVDVAGHVEAVGRDVTAFRPGDEVFGFCEEGFAEYVRIGEPELVRPKPARLGFEEAAAIPLAAGTALHALRDRARVRAGQRVLVNGAAGGIGTFAVQIAKALGAEVTGVCGTGNVELVRALGADHVVDYSKEDFARAGRRYDALIDLVGNRSLSDRLRALTPKGALVPVAPAPGQWIGPLWGVAKPLLAAPFVRRRLLPFLYAPNGDDLATLAGLVESGAVTPVIDRAYPLHDLPQAVRYLEQGHARGKVVITV